MYVFTRGPRGWYQVADLGGPGVTSDDFFGGSVGICGATIVVGAPDAAPGTGQAYVYTWSWGRWRQSAALRGGDTAAGDRFGTSVAVSGATIVVGAPGHAGRAGRSYVFTKGPAGWRQAGELEGADTGTGDDFGVAVAVSAQSIVVGAPAHAGAAGSAYVFTRNRGAWRQSAELEGADTRAGDVFGWSVAMSGRTIVVGAHDHLTSGPGRAYVFARGPRGWRQVGELAGSDTVAGDGFSGPVAISGATIMAGAQGHAGDAGRAYVFTRTATSWRQEAELSEPKAAPLDLFGDSLAVSGSTALIGAPGYGPSDVGRAYVVAITGLQ